MIHKEGYPSLIIAGLILTILTFITYVKFSPNLFYIVLLVSLILFVFLLQFFRNPKRPIATLDNNIIYAPADGKIVVIEEVEEPEYFKAKRKQVSIFMNPLNVHVNRAPIDGEVSFYKYHAGKYLAAWNPKSSTENERTTVVIKNEGTEILLRQIAGALARRIVCFVDKGHKLKQGEDFGFIKLGSRVDLFLPLDAEILVSKEDIVKGNIHPIAKLS